MPPQRHRSNNQRSKPEFDASYKPGDTPGSSHPRRLGRGRSRVGRARGSRGQSTNGTSRGGDAQNNGSHTNAGTAADPPTGLPIEFDPTFRPTPTSILKDYHGFVTLRHGVRGEGSLERAVEVVRVQNAAVAAAGRSEGSGVDTAGLGAITTELATATRQGSGHPSPALKEGQDRLYTFRKGANCAVPDRGSTFAEEPRRGVESGLKYNNSRENATSTRRDGADLDTLDNNSTTLAFGRRGIESSLSQILEATSLEISLKEKQADSRAEGPEHQPNPVADTAEAHSAADSAVNVNTPAETATETPGMAPMATQMNAGMNQVQDSLKDVIQDLFDMQSMVHGYQPETEGPLIDKMLDLTNSLSHVRNLASTGPNAHPSSVAHTLPSVAPELIDYVDEGRNPDIYTREIVESVQRGNAILHGRQQAFASFSEILARKLRESDERRKQAEKEEGREGQGRGGIDVSREVGKIMRNAGLEIEEGGKKERNGRRDERKEGGVNDSDKMVV